MAAKKNRRLPDYKMFVPLYQRNRHRSLRSLIEEAIEGAPTVGDQPSFFLGMTVAELLNWQSTSRENEGRTLGQLLQEAEVLFPNQPVGELTVAQLLSLPAID